MSNIIRPAWNSNMSMLDNIWQKLWNHSTNDYKKLLDDYNKLKAENEMLKKTIKRLQNPWQERLDIPVDERRKAVEVALKFSKHI